MYSVLFVCSANICRSPMAMGLLQSLARQEAGQWRIASAGIWAQPGYPAAVNTQLILWRKGIDLSQHDSRPIRRDWMAEFNLILTMERGQKEALRAAFPEYAGKVFLLSEMIGQVGDIADPIGEPLAAFEETAAEIEQILSQGLAQIRSLAEDRPAEK
jgi:protein-tyrosine-phosphatase